MIRADGSFPKPQTGAPQYVPSNTVFLIIGTPQKRDTICWETPLKPHLTPMCLLQRDIFQNHSHSLPSRGEMKPGQTEADKANAFKPPLSQHHLNFSYSYDTMINVLTSIAFFILVILKTNSGLLLRNHIIIHNGVSSL